MKIFGFLICLLCLASCSENNTFVLEGKLTDDKYNGEFIYLVPMFNATKETVDSALIYNQKFTITCPADLTQLYILRMRPKHRMAMQQLLIAKEAGRVEALIDSASSAGGTPLNNDLQLWKLQQDKFTQLYFDLDRRYNNNGAAPSDSYRSSVDSLKRLEVSSQVEFVRRNRDNVFGKFLTDRYGKRFSDDVKQELSFD